MGKRKVLERGASGTVLGWNRLALQAVQRAQAGAAAAARALAILHTCMYNAWAAYDDHARQTVHGVAVRLPRGERSAASKASAMSHAAYLALVHQFPAQQACFDGHMAGLALDPTASGAPLSPAGIGRTQAFSVLDAYRRHAWPARREAAGREIAPGHWCLLAQAVSAREGHDDDRDVCLFFALATAMEEAEPLRQPLRQLA